MLNVRLPALIDYVAFYQTVPVPHHYPEEGTHGNMPSWVVCDIQGLLLAFWLCLHHTFLYTALCIMKVCSFASAQLVSPADRHMFVHDPPAEIRNVVENPLKTSSHQPLGIPPGMPLNFSTFKLWNLWWLSTGATSGGYTVLIVTQQVEGKILSFSSWDRFICTKVVAHGGAIKPTSIPSYPFEGQQPGNT